MEVRIVARHAHRLHRIVRVFRCQLLQLIEDLLADEVALLHPSHLASGVTYFGEPPIMIEHLHTVAVFYLACLLERLRDAVAKIDAYAGDVGDFEHASTAVLAGGEHQGEQECEGRETQPGWEGSFHGVNLSI